jgi:protein-disulfide isomerase
MQSENKFLIPISVLIAGALIAGAVFFKSKDPAPNTGDSGTPEDIVVAPVSAEDHVLGNPNAEIAIIEYSDIDCPFCKDFHTTMHRIMDEYGTNGQVAWVYRDFPLDQLHPEARKKAEATECVASLAGNDAYWNFIDALFARNETAADLPAIAAEFGVNQAAFTKCLSDGTFAAAVKADGDAAFAAGGRGTPYSVILATDGSTFPINGAQPYEVVKQVIDTLLTDQAQ